METIINALRSKTVLKAIILGVSSIAVAILTQVDLIAWVGIVNMVVDIALRAITTEPLSAK
jgi:hypothetical protein